MPEPSGQLSGEETFGGPPLPTEWSADPPVVRGTGYTEAEIAALLRREGYAVKQMVASETGYAPEELRICREGYCHTSLGEENYYGKLLWQSCLTLVVSLAIF